MNIVVLGSGGWGTAAAMLLSDNGHTVALWSHDPKKAELLDMLSNQFFRLIVG